MGRGAAVRITSKVPAAPDCSTALSPTESDRGNGRLIDRLLKVAQASAKEGAKKVQFTGRKSILSPFITPYRAA